MTLGELLDNITVQSNIEIRKWEDDELDSYYFEDCEQLFSSTVERESKGLFNSEMTVTYIYAETFTKHYPNSVSQCGCLVIEVE